MNAQCLQINSYSAGDWSSRQEEITPLDKTPLHIAVEDEDEELVAMLLAAGALGWWVCVLLERHCLARKWGWGQGVG